MNQKFNRFSQKYLTGAELIGPERYPKLQATQFIPENVVSFSERNNIKNPHDYCLDHFIYDYFFEPVWVNCDKYLKKYKQFKTIITTDFSAYRDAPLWERKYNVGRNRTIAYYLQKNGIDVVPVASWAYMEDFDWCLDGLPQNASIAISTNGCMKNFVSYTVLIDGIKTLQELLKPSHLIICGGPLPEIDSQYNNINYYNSFSQRMTRRIKYGK